MPGEGEPALRCVPLFIFQTGFGPGVRAGDNVGDGLGFGVRAGDNVGDGFGFGVAVGVLASDGFGDALADGIGSLLCGLAFWS